MSLLKFGFVQTVQTKRKREDEQEDGEKFSGSDCNNMTSQSTSLADTSLSSMDTTNSGTGRLLSIC